MHLNKGIHSFQLSCFYMVFLLNKTKGNLRKGKAITLIKCVPAALVHFHRTPVTISHRKRHNTSANVQAHLALLMSKKDLFIFHTSSLRERICTVKYSRELKYCFY